MAHVRTIRLTLGAVFAPLAPALFLIVFFWRHDIGPDRFGFPSYYHAQDIARLSFDTLGYLTLALGMWPYARLKSRGWVGLRHFALAGLVLGPIGGLYFLAADQVFGAYSDGAPATALTPFAWLGASMGIGAGTTSTFWLIARPDRMT